MTLDLAEALKTIGRGPLAAAVDRARAWSVIDAALRNEWSSGIAQRAGVASELDDVRQLVLEKLLAGRPTFRGDTEEEARALLRVLVHRTAVDLRRARTKEVNLVPGDLERAPSDANTTDAIGLRELQSRLRELVEAAGTIQRGPDAAILERHLREALVGQPAVDPSLDVDPRAAAKLRQERSRSFRLLRRAQVQILDGAPEGRPDAVDRVLGQLIAAKRKEPDQDDDG